jgi:SAM-dependent MidA family methyltransferase
MPEDEQHPEPERSIRRAIAEHGPISFAEFMELALYGPGGFYEEPPVGERGHFVTSPHVHPVFGMLLAEAIRECWDHFGSQDPITLVEVGAGDGTLAQQLCRELETIPVEYTAVERSPGARRALSDVRPDIRVAASIEALDQHVEGVILANELLDNLPFRWIRRDDLGYLQEVLVELRDGHFAALERPFPEEDGEALEAVPEPLAPGADGVLPEGALHFVERLARGLHRGYALLIDYATGPEAEIHGYRSHRVVEDVLDQPGSADITAGVDFRVLREHAEALGLRSFEPVTQRSALMALGYDRWSTGERSRQADAQDRRSGREAVAAWSSRNAAAELVDPEGLGRLRWWVVATPDMPEPAWLGRASLLDLADISEIPHQASGGFISYVDIRRRRWWELPGKKRRMSPPVYGPTEAVLFDEDETDEAT